MSVRNIEWKKPYTWGKAISIDENKVISLNLRDENNLIIYDSWDDEIYVDLQLPDWIKPTQAFPVGVTTGRVLVADWRDVTWTIICAKTTSWDNIKILYGDDGKLYVDNWTWIFKQIYLKGEVDALLQALREYIDAQLALKQDKLTAWDNITIDANNVISASGWGDVKMFTLPAVLSSAEALEVAQEALDWYFDWKTPILRHENDFNIYGCSWENQSWLLTPITYWLEFDNILLAEWIVENANYRMPSSMVDNKIRFTYDENTHEVTLVESIYVQQDFLPSNSSTEVVYNPSHNRDPTTKEYVDDSLAWKQDKLTAWDNITIGNVTHPNNQWPCPDWYHVATETEWSTLISILTTTFSLSSNGATVKTYLKMPLAWYRTTSGNLLDQDTSGSYWSCIMLDTSTSYGRRVNPTQYNILSNGAYVTSAGSIRPFKNTAVIPDTSWTTLYDWSSMATWASVYDPWVYHNASLWLISASWDGVDWITIADKNLWATTVYNSWDTLSEANSWNYFQWWNNYPFPFTGTVTTQDAQVDASWYGPGNYYNSSTFLTWARNWSSVVNLNLWGGTNPTWTWTALTISATSDYIIQTSSSAPASWTSNNIITLVI